MIGPQTAKTAKELGLRVDVQAESASALALADALAAHGVARRAEGDALPPGKLNRARRTAKPKRSR